VKVRAVALAGTLTVATGLVGVATPASATTTGVLVFAGTVTLPAFPCSACTATFTSTLATGVYGSTVVTQISATVDYSDTCVGGQPLIGVADSTSFVQVNGSPTGIRIHWARAGLVAVISTGAGSLDSVNGAAVFTPTSVASCASPGAVTAALVGTVVTT